MGTGPSISVPGKVKTKRPGERGSPGRGTRGGGTVARAPCEVRGAELHGTWTSAHQPRSASDKHAFSTASRHASAWVGPHTWITLSALNAVTIHPSGVCTSPADHPARRSRSWDSLTA